MSWVAVAVVGAAVVTTVSAQDSQRKATHAQQDALNAAAADDARAKVEAETTAATDANAKLAADKRARQANVLALGGGSDSTLGSPGGGTRPGTVLSAGAPAAARAAAASTTSVLGGGAVASGLTRGGFVSTPRTPTPGTSI